MSNEQEPRRQFLRRMLAAVPTASLATGAAFSQSACKPAAPPAAAPKPYQPDYFTADEWRFLEAAVDRLIPADRLGPGAREAGVPEFIDRQMETPWGYGKLWYMQGPFHVSEAPELGYQMNLAPRELYRHGIKACDDWCRAHHGGKSFAELTTADQDALLGEMDHGKTHFDTVAAATFFSFLLANTKEGFFADPLYGGNKAMAGWKTIGFPGARADFADWLDQPGAKYPYGPVSIDGSRG